MQLGYNHFNRLSAVSKFIIEESKYIKNIQFFH